MAAPTLSRKTLEDLERRHIAFLEERLVSRQAREDWIQAFRDGYQELLGVRIRDVLEPAVIAAGLHRILTADAVRTFFAPLVRDVHREVLASLKADGTRVGDYVPAKARHAIDALLDRDDLIPEALVRKIFEQQAIEDAIDDTLYEALTQFNTSVNPFFADWGLPAILKRMPFGGGLILTSMEAMRAEFDRRLEPEIRKFLAAFSRRATGELSELFITRSGDPRFIELRKNLVAFLYSQSLGELLGGIDEKASGAGGIAVEHVVLAVLQRDRRGEGLRRALEKFVEGQGDSTFRQWLERIGATGRPDLDACAELLWPHVEAAVRSPLVRDFLRRITAEFYAELAR
ncbi:MAG: hypothetical protein HY899_06555 [Deltaproteobacteria bacterium]|nr:hypothetical protein [Deltaproteobacteria bacterium]